MSNFDFLLFLPQSWKTARVDQKHGPWCCSSGAGLGQVTSDPVVQCQCHGRPGFDWSGGVVCRKLIGLWLKEKSPFLWMAFTVTWWKLCSEKLWLQTTLRPGLAPAPDAEVHSSVKLPLISQWASVSARVTPLTPFSVFHYGGVSPDTDLESGSIFNLSGATQTASSSSCLFSNKRRGFFYLPISETLKHQGRL